MDIAGAGPGMCMPGYSTFRRTCTAMAIRGSFIMENHSIADGRKWRKRVY
jgi:hypothetical protein